MEHISKLPNLTEFTCSTHTVTLPKDALEPLATHPTLKRVNYGSYDNTGGYVALIKLHQARQRAGLPPLQLGDTRTGELENFENCERSFGANFTLCTPGIPSTFKVQGE